MKINQDGYAEQEHAGESVPAAMQNARNAARKAAEEIVGLCAATGTPSLATWKHAVEWHHQEVARVEDIIIAALAAKETECQRLKADVKFWQDRCTRE